MFYRNFSLAMVLILGGSGIGGLPPIAAADPDTLHIGITNSQAQELPSSLQSFLVPEFGEMMNAFTGIKNVIVPGLDPYTAARQMATGKLHLCVLQGVEFAWLQAKYPDLQPLMVASYDTPERRALLVVRNEDPFQGFVDLKGKNVNVLQSKLHCRLFADRGVGGKAENYFGKLSLKFSAEESLDDLLLGNVQAAVVDNALLDSYKSLNPGRFKRLKIIAQSEPFPASVMVYRSGDLSDKLLNTLRTGILDAGKAERIQEMMTFFRVKGFQTVPADYQQSLSHILKTYPPASGK